MSKVVKLMWAGNSTFPFFDMVNETVCNKLKMEKAIEFLDINKWKNEFSESYLAWLNNDVNIIYDVHSPLNINMIEKIREFNKRNKNYEINYWFDINREEFPNYKWENCPLSNTPLIDLGSDMPLINRLISKNYPIVTPL